MRQISLTVLISAAVALAVQLWIAPHVLPAEATPPHERGAVLVDPIEERSLDLPEDAHTWHTILLVQPNWREIPAERRVETLFHSEPQLVSLKHQTHWHLITTADPEFAKFRSLVDSTPCLLVERANGQVIYRGSGHDLGHRPPELTRSIRRQVERHCPRGRCLPIHPQPPFGPDDNRHRGADDRDGEDEIPLLFRESDDGAGSSDAGGVWVALTAVGAALSGVAYQWKKSS